LAPAFGVSAGFPRVPTQDFIETANRFGAAANFVIIEPLSRAWMERRLACKLRRKRSAYMCCAIEPDADDPNRGRQLGLICAHCASCKGNRFRLTASCVKATIHKNMNNFVKIIENLMA
jgi:hypothetical protein